MEYLLSIDKHKVACQKPHYQKTNSFKCLWDTKFPPISTIGANLISNLLGASVIRGSPLLQNGNISFNYKTNFQVHQKRMRILSRVLHNIMNKKPFFISRFQIMVQDFYKPPLYLLHKCDCSFHWFVLQKLLFALAPIRKW